MSDKALKMPPKFPKDLPERLPDLPRRPPGPPKAFKMVTQMSPQGVQKAPKGPPKYVLILLWN